jgi:hypothetical protein
LPTVSSQVAELDCTNKQLEAELCALRAEAARLRSQLSTAADPSRDIAFTDLV